MSVPSWYQLILLGLAAWRTWWLIGQDTILDQPRRYVTTHARWTETWFECPFCSGFWTALAWWGGWQAWPHEALVVAGAVALTALVPLLERVTSDE